MLTKAELDRAKCRHPGCDCGKVILSGRCHPGAPLLLVRTLQKVLETFCGYCHHLVAPLEGTLVLGSGEEFPLDNEVFDQKCHPDAPLWVFYIHNSGVITITCAECDKEVAEVILNE